MSYILDALKKSEREKMLGQVPTLETVVSHGTVKRRIGKPWWLNLLVFLLGLLAILITMYWAGLINLSSFSDFSFTTKTDKLKNTTTSRSQPANTIVEQQKKKADVISKSPKISTEKIQSEVQILETDQSVVAEPIVEIKDITASTQQTNLINTTIKNQQITQIEGHSNEIIPETVQDKQLLATQQQAGLDYETVLPEKLRNITVNVVSYSSDPRQRFVMIDLTIYKRGDSIPGGAEIVEVIQSGVIVEFENRRYLVKP